MCHISVLNGKVQYTLETPIGVITRMGQAKNEKKTTLRCIVPNVVSQPTSTQA